MRTSRVFRAASASAVLASALLAGCATLKSSYPSPDSAARKRQERSEEAVRQFEASRDEAEYQAAVNRWNERDIAGCHERLHRLLARNPNHRGARLLLAELQLNTNRLADARQNVQAALQNSPDDPEAQFAMGLVLDAGGDSNAAMAHYQRAAKSDPDNEVYAVGYYTALESAQRTAVATNQPLPQERRAVAATPPALLPSAEVAQPGALVDFLVSGGGTDAVDNLAARATSDPKALPTAPPGNADGGQAPPASDARDVKQSKHDEGNGSSDSNDGATVAELVRKGHSAMNEGSLEESLAYFRAAAAFRPGNQQVLISAAVNALRHNQPELAIELVAPDGKPIARHATIYRILGTAYYRRGDYRAARTALDQALSLDKSSPLSYFLMGCTLSKLGQNESAETYLRQARTLDPRYGVQRR